MFIKAAEKKIILLYLNALTLKTNNQINSKNI